jgi:hypothetical protein
MNVMKHIFIITIILGYVNVNFSAAQITFQKTYLGNAGAGRNIQQTTDGGYILAGRTNQLGAGAKDMYLVKTDSTGVISWAKSYGAIANEYAYSVQQTSDGGYVMVAWTNSFSGVDSALNVYLIKTNSTGVLTWSKVIGNSQWDHGSDVRQTTDGGYIVCGYSGAGSNDYLYLVKTDAGGNIVWEKKYIGNQEVGFSVFQTTDGSTTRSV